MTKKKKINLDIDTKYNVNSKFIIINKNLMRDQFYLSIVCGKASGKTLLIANIVHKYKKVYDDGDIYIFTNSYVPTLYNLQKTRGAHIFNSNYDKFGHCILSQILQHQKEEKTEDYKNLKHVLIIFYDYIKNNALNERRCIFSTLWSMARNFNISLIISSQEFKLIPAPLRKMSDYYIIYKIKNTKEKEDLINECNNFLDEKEFEKVYNHAVKEKYNFLFSMIDENRFLKNFKEELANEKNGIVIKDEIL